MLVPRKIERPRLKDLNSNSFDLNSNDLNGSEGLGRSKNVEKLGGASIKEVRIVGKVWGPNLK